ncbi:hypothetical protein [Saccharopolyspora sp. ASAGF58]|uniref:hypothetical protein n=1 Tax=Saccharopolyspora sp. ASAGF58 TaxID=2719023 RepID=UPI001446002D|nr:hypothetical protein [Saccharopolyspora sp. ASAGF58]
MIFDIGSWDPIATALRDCLGLGGEVPVVVQMLATDDGGLTEFGEAVPAVIPECVQRSARSIGGVTPSV